jgi:hypothetical protein
MATILRIRKGQIERVEVTDAEVNSLEWMQGEVGGYIEIAGCEHPGPVGIVVWCNEEGKLLGLPPNVLRWDGEVLVGILIVMGATPEGQNRGLTEEEIKRVEVIPVAGGYPRGVPMLRVAPEVKGAR